MCHIIGIMKWWGVDVVSMNGGWDFPVAIAHLSQPTSHRGSNHGGLIAQPPFEGLQKIHGRRERSAHGAVHQHDVSVLPRTQQGQTDFEGTHVESLEVVFWLVVGPPL